MLCKKCILCSSGACSLNWARGGGKELQGVQSGGLFGEVDK